MQSNPYYIKNLINSICELNRNYFRKKFLGQQVSRLEAIINDPSYKRLSPTEKRRRLFSGPKSHVAQVRKRAFQLADTVLHSMELPRRKGKGLMESPRISSALDRAKFNELPLKDRKAVQEFFIETERGDIQENNYYKYKELKEFLKTDIELYNKYSNELMQITKQIMEIQ